MKTIGYIATTIALVIYGTIMHGWALSLLWSWFIVTTFGLPALSIPAAIGISGIIRFITFKVEAKKSDETYSEALLKSAMVSTFNPLISLGFGSVVKMWL